MNREILIGPDFAGDVTHWIEDGEGDDQVITSVQDVTPILERNKALQTHNDGYTPSRDLRRAATIPAIVRLKWILEEGWDCLDPGAVHKLAQKLNDPEWRFLRTAPGVLGVSNGVMR